MDRTLSFCVERRHLLKEMVVSKLAADQKDMMLGYLWWVLDPLLLMLVYWFMIGVIFKKGGHLYPVFILCGLMPHRAFSISFGGSVTSISASFGIIRQVNFPRLFLPISRVCVEHVKLVFGLFTVVIIAIFFGIGIDYSIILLIIPLTIQVIFVSGLAMLMAVLGVYFRDLRNITQLLMRILLYLSPVLYSIEQIPEKFRDIFLLNPLASLYVTYRAIIMHETTINPSLMMICFGEALVFLLVGYLFFVRHDRKLLKYM